MYMCGRTCCVVIVAATVNPLWGDYGMAKPTPHTIHKSFTINEIEDNIFNSQDLTACARFVRWPRERRLLSPTVCCVLLQAFCFVALADAPLTTLLIGAAQDDTAAARYSTVSRVF